MIALVPAQTPQGRILRVVLPAGRFQESSDHHMCTSERICWNVEGDSVIEGDSVEGTGHGKL